mmetsp:Transcript_49116/g.57374  ORF Transcript_49116/g.57374 Transcript_49116/m.57374 type:complete len:87 (-) Transcript_49116:237-497(-)
MCVCLSFYQLFSDVSPTLSMEKPRCGPKALYPFIKENSPKPILQHSNIWKNVLSDSSGYFPTVPFGVLPKRNPKSEKYRARSIPVP